MVRWRCIGRYPGSGPASSMGAREDRMDNLPLGFCRRCRGTGKLRVMVYDCDDRHVRDDPDMVCNLCFGSGRVSTIVETRPLPKQRLHTMSGSSRTCLSRSEEHTSEL